jgi:hypothetical protein
MPCANSVNLNRTTHLIDLQLIKVYVVFIPPNNFCNLEPNIIFEIQI